MKETTDPASYRLNMGATSSTHNLHQQCCNQTGWERELLKQQKKSVTADGTTSTTNIIAVTEE